MIRILDSQVAEMIAAGEVIEHPAAVVKELVENSLDAGADRIEISVSDGGKRSIRVTDNGSGIAPGDVELAFSRFATSKLASLEDLEAITSLGFRGEALPSIAAVARVTLTTRRKEDFAATRIRLEGGVISASEAAGAPEGTEVLVEDLFFNTPGRLKFLRGGPRELAKISALVTSMALAHPDCSFTLVSDGKNVLRTTGDGSLLHAIGALYGKEAAAAMLQLRSHDPSQKILLEGFLSAPHFSRASRRWITVVINGRVVQCPLLAGALERAYGGMLARRRHPVAVLILKAPPEMLDVNVHPAKSEIRFQRPEIFNELVFPGGAQGSARPAGGRARARLDQGAAKGVAAAAAGAALSRGGEEGRVTAPFTSGQAPPADDLAVHPEAVTPSSLANETIPGDGAGRCRLIGQFLHSYLVAQEGEELLVIDQHAAHERVLYHALCSREPGKRPAQLTLPLNLELPPAWAVRLEEILPLLEEAGFMLEPFGDNSYILRAIPFYCGKAAIPGFTLSWRIYSRKSRSRAWRAVSVFYKKLPAMVRLRHSSRSPGPRPNSCCATGRRLPAPPAARTAARR